MSRIVKVCMISLAMTATSATISSAADLGLPTPVIDHQPFVGGGGFYLRGDIGYSIWKNPSLTNFNANNGINNRFINEESTNEFLIGGGVGYKFRKYLRVDITGDIRTSKDITGESPCGCAIIAGFPAGFETQNQSTTLELATFFANAYIEPFEFRRFTPYVGGGVGFAYVGYGTYISANNPTTNNTGLTAAVIQGAPVGTGPNPSNVENQLFQGESEFRFAWNLQAGASYDINDNLALDGSYRYTRINNGTVANIVAGSNVTEEGDLVGHEFRLGLRYTFGGPKSYAPEPIFK